MQAPLSPEIHVFGIRVLFKHSSGVITTLTATSASEALAQARKLYPETKLIEISPPPHYPRWKEVR